MKYFSKRDFFMGILTFGIFIFASTMAIYEEGFSFQLFAILFLVFLYLLNFWFRTYYVIEDNHLIVHYSFFKRKINIFQIKEVKETINFLSAPACSFDRLLIKGNRIKTIISPKEKEDFISHLLKINPNIIFSER